ncbi:MAG: LysM peptidoglycan-binding domain-containing protein, partial [Bacteroidaceae bacterium]|nr:LysM peptidoglycan-binding domain-containing protein [Bacteroidaceae bacterium]
MNRLGTIIAALCFSAVAINAQQATFTHTVGRGETLYSIATQYGTSVSEIIRLNPSAEQVIKVGQILTIPSASQSDGKVKYHTIEAGETLY